MCYNFICIQNLNRIRNYNIKKDGYDEEKATPKSNDTQKSSFK